MKNKTTVQTVPQVGTFEKVSLVVFPLAVIVMAAIGIITHAA